MSKDTGGPAFPTLETETFHPHFGMTLRDYFAAQTVAGLAWDGALHATEIATRAYCLADAMLAERAKDGA